MYIYAWKIHDLLYIHITCTLYICLYQALLKRHQDELAKDKTELDAKLASASSQEEVAKVIKDHERRLQVLHARQQREKEENMAALKQKLIARKSGKVSITNGQSPVNACPSLYLQNKSTLPYHQNRDKLMRISIPHFHYHRQNT